MSTTTTRGACPDPELFTALVDSELDRATQDVVLDHVSTCADCAETLSTERRIRSLVVGLGEEPTDADGDPLVPSADLTARLLAIPASGGREAAPTRIDRPRRLPAYLGAAASVVVLMVGAFAFIGASTDGGGSPASPVRTTAIVPAADRLAQEHAVTAVQAGFGGPGTDAMTGSQPQIVPVSAP